MKKLLISLSILMSVCSCSLAQSTDTYKPVLKKMLHAAGTEASFSAAIKQIFSIFKQQKSNIPEAVWNEAEAEFSKTSLDDVVEMLTPIYQKYFTEADLNKIAEFYQTPAGRKLAEKTPFITQESLLAGQEWGKQVMEKLKARLNAKGYN